MVTDKTDETLPLKVQRSVYMRSDRFEELMTVANRLGISLSDLLNVAAYIVYLSPNLTKVQLAELLDDTEPPKGDSDDE